MPWIWASSVVRGKEELLAHGDWSEMCVHLCLGALLWVRHSWYVVWCSQHQLSVGAAPGTASPEPGSWPRGAGAEGWTGACQGTVVAIACLWALFVNLPFSLITVKTSYNTYSWPVASPGSRWRVLRALRVQHQMCFRCLTDIYKPLQGVVF